MINAIIIGCGNIGGGFDAERPADSWPLAHAGAFVRDGRFRIVGCVDPDADRRRVFAARWGIPHAVADLSELNSIPVDVISIASPTAYHATNIDAALLLRPRLLFCEKPVTPNAETTREYVARAEARGILFAVNHNRRWAPDLVELAHELRNGVHGAIRSATGWYAKGVLNNGAHMIDLLHMLLGPVEVIAAGKATYDFWPDDPTVSALLRAGDVPIHLVAGDARDYTRFELEIATESGVFTMEDGGRSWRVRRPAVSATFAGYRSLSVTDRRVGRYDETMTLAVGNIHDALTSGATLASDGRSALAAQTVCERIRALSESTT